MSCDLAVSIAKAAVTKQHLLDLLTTDVVQQVVLKYLQSEYANDFPRVRYASARWVRFEVGDVTISINIKNGVVMVRSESGDSAEAEDFAQKIELLLARLADSLFQQKVQQALG